MPVESCKVLGEWVSADPRLLGAAERAPCTLKIAKKLSQGRNLARDLLNLQECIFGK